MNSGSEYHSICLLLPYFGTLPKWTPLFLETIRKNKTIDFHFFTNSQMGSDLPDNVIVHEMDFQEYISNANSFLDFVFEPKTPYKLCDLRPLFGLIHYDIIKNYDFYGWTDVDILFGDIRSFYTNEILEKYDVLSTHVHRISGHFALFRTTMRNITQYLKIYNWKQALQHPEFVGIDEHGLTNAYLYTILDKLHYKLKLPRPQILNQKFRNRKKRKMYMVEQYTTPFLPTPWIDGTINSEQPDKWYYINGTVTNNRDEGRKFMYLHFMNFKSSKWRHDNTRAPWEKNELRITATPEDMASGIVIDAEGIRKIV